MKFSQIGEDWKQIHRECLKEPLINAMKPLLNGKMAHCSGLLGTFRPWYISKKRYYWWVNYAYRRHHSFKKQKDQEKRRIVRLLNQYGLFGTWEVYPALGKFHGAGLQRKFMKWEVEKPDLANREVNFFKPGESQTIIERVVTEAIEKGLLEWRWN
jgi:hypothetical protein